MASRKLPKPLKNYKDDITYFFDSYIFNKFPRQA